MAELSKLGRYQLRRVLGRGAMGVVYEGFDPNLERRVAVKTILKAAALDEETERAYSERFVKEAKAVARLSHPNIVQVYDFGEENEIAYLVMEFIQGRELRSFLGAGEKFIPAEAVRIMGELLDALDFAHEVNVIHRDVKPANVMLDEQRRVKLADFGVARVQDSDLSAAGTMVGTPAFMSPEQIQGQKIDRRTDIFSAGVVLYQLLTGEQPFKGAGAWTVAKQIMQEDPPLPSSFVSNVSPAFDEIVERALAKRPADRYATAREFAADLRRTQGSAPAAPAAPRPAAPRPKRISSDAEIEFWRSIQNSDAAAEFEVYLKKFPDGTYAELAQIKLDKLRQPDADDATVAIIERRPAASPPAEKKRSMAAPAFIGLALIAAGTGAYLYMGRAPVPVADTAPPTQVEKVAPAKPEVNAADIEKAKKETEERIRREFADKSAAEQAAATKAANEKAIQEKMASVKAAADKAAAEKLAADKALAAKSAAERLAAEHAAAEKAVAEKAAAEKATADRLAADKAAADKAATERVAREKATEEKAKLAATSSIEQFKARHPGKVEEAEPPTGSIQYKEIIYINDKSCPPGQIRELTGGSPFRGVDRK
ncbi:MAG TPA: serine/threonine-protein kinase, partial [Burkholderiales bacterium]|nr:serine/threonine-protein kinase [Burkholderiales bacterium]